MERVVLMVRVVPVGMGERLPAISMIAMDTPTIGQKVSGIHCMASGERTSRGGADRFTCTQHG
ncbi:hypothetical protein A6A28_26120 [Streptomyces sp. CB03578]|nr:hypothetical protein A6A28_26120 [Streptomyces sp. CB03578]